MILLDHKMNLEYMFDLKLSINTDLKEAISRKAGIEFIDDGDGFLLDSGTTYLAIARQLHHRNGCWVLATDVEDTRQNSATMGT